jgi:hypothetical protein
MPPREPTGAADQASPPLIGIAEDSGYVHVMFVFRDPNQQEQPFDESYGVSFKLPVREDS